MRRTLGLIIAAFAASLALGACGTDGVGDGGARPPHGAAGGLCGGIAGFQCQRGLFCQMTPGQCRTVADAAGVCRKPPQICTAIYAPVCGCDGQTYSNSCRAAAAGVSVASNGACRSQDK